MATDSELGENPNLTTMNDELQVMSRPNAAQAQERAEAVSKLHLVS